MAEVTVIATLEARPGRVEELWALCLGLLEPTRAEPGCIVYEVFSSAEHPSRIVFVERWSSAAALDTHLQSPHITAALERLPELACGGPEIQRLTRRG